MKDTNGSGKEMCCAESMEIDALYCFIVIALYIYIHLQISIIYIYMIDKYIIIFIEEIQGTESPNFKIEEKTEK
jgi:hypothetical protein